MSVGSSQPHPPARVALGMSGGVDSSTSAALLLDSGYEVLGVTCVFCDDGRSLQATADAKEAASALGIEHVVRDCAERFERFVIAPFVEGYAQGLTPSPCVVCNATCKLPSLIAAADECGCDYVATGHYANVVRAGGHFAVKAAACAGKDQSYMLCMLAQEQLSRLVLPLGCVEGGKQEVRSIAGSLGLRCASSPDSQDICFIEGSHIDFLKSRGLADHPGDIVDTSGAVLGHHHGLYRYTQGQRKGIGIGGAGRPYYVVGFDVAANRLVVGFAEDARMSGVHCSGLNWQALSSKDAALKAGAAGFIEGFVKLRYRQKAVKCRVFLETADESAKIILDEPVSLTAPGQYAVVYGSDSDILCAGVIDEVFKA